MGEIIGNVNLEVGEYDLRELEELVYEDGQEFMYTLPITLNNGEEKFVTLTFKKENLDG